MTQTDTRSGTEVVAQSQPLRTTSIFAIVIVALVALIGVHITQGTAVIGFGDLVKLVWGGGDDTTWNILVGSRLPRMVSGVLVGIALGCAGCALQSLARNTLASPDTLGVNAGAYLAVSIVAAFGISLPVLSGSLVAFAGGLAAVTLALATGSSGPTRLILAGSAIALASSSLANLMLILFQENTRGLYKWGNGSLLQVDIGASLQMAPVILVMCAILVIAGRRLDLLGLGDDAAASLGLNVKTTRVWVVLAAVMLTAAAVSIAGPIGFVGLAAPVIVRLYAVRHGHLHRHHVLIPLSGLAGAILVIGADIGLRALLGPEAGVEVPTGVITAILGSIVLVTLARQLPDSGNTPQPPGAHFGTARSSWHTTVVLATLSVLLVAALAGAVLLGDTWILFGDVVNWAKGQAGYTVSAVMAERTPRVLAAALAGVALGLAGVATQAVARNPLAEPSLLGITAGAGLGAIIVISYSATIGIWALQAAAFTGALIAFVLVYSLAWRGGINSDRLILVGIGVSVGLESLISLIIITTDPWNLAKSITWLAGSTYGRSYAQLIPVIIALVVIIPVMIGHRRELDLISIDDSTARSHGVSLERARWIVLLSAVLLTATAVTVVGLIVFVGLVAPHLARALVGSQHRRVIPVAALIGALVVSVADTAGRTVIAPAQIPAGLLTALLGTPYFLWLLWRSRR